MQFTRRLPVFRRYFASATQSRLNTVSATQPPAMPNWVGYEEPDEHLPVAIGDVLDSRYVVKQKLGSGFYSTVWLAERNSSSFPRFSALKILTREGTEILPELEYLQTMRDKNTMHPGHAHNIQLLDHFYLGAPGQHHLCLVTEALCQDLHSFASRWPYRALPLPLIRQVARQVLLGLDYLHSECNIIHTDIKPANILFAPAGDPASLFEAAIAQSNDFNEMSVASDPDELDIPYIIPENINSSEAWQSARVELIDVGVASWTDKVSERSEIISSSALRAPEVCIRAGWGKPADIWSLGCTLYELCLGMPIFPPDRSNIDYPNMHVEVFGMYPPGLVRRGKDSHIYFNSDGSLIRVNPECIPPFDDLLADRLDASPEFVDFMHQILTLDPARRPTCQDLLAHDWLNPRQHPTVSGRLSNFVSTLTKLWRQ
ncbi:kinase-like protein [Auriscalpium vulgare]|uniref:Kinase-like protein n=1 Tax=Auriscalpium vulgare TaxID=40419 RepID=A0ACB8R941_9AGAM|nr:kinase-like protein [Auriscalpium vulgare]